MTKKERFYIKLNTVYDFSEYKDCVTFLPYKVPIINGSLRLKHYRTPPEYLARLVGYDPVVGFQRQFVRPTKTVRAKKRYPCGQKKRIRTEYEFPLPDGIYELQQRGTKQYKKNNFWDYSQRMYIKFLDNKIIVIDKSDAMKEIYGDKYQATNPLNYA